MYIKIHAKKVFSSTKLKNKLKSPVSSDLTWIHDNLPKDRTFNSKMEFNTSMKILDKETPGQQSFAPFEDSDREN